MFCWLVQLLFKYLHTSFHYTIWIRMIKWNQIIFYFILFTEYCKLWTEDATGIPYINHLYVHSPLCMLIVWLLTLLINPNLLICIRQVPYTEIKWQTCLRICSVEQTLIHILHKYVCVWWDPIITCHCFFMISFSLCIPTQLPLYLTMHIVLVVHYPSTVIKL